MSRLLEGGRVFVEGELREESVLVEEGRVSEVGTGLSGEETVDCSGLVILPGAVDIHVHFRDMEQAEKETWRTGSMAAAAGGVTCVLDQPNTSPPTRDRASLERKLEAAERSLVDYCVAGELSPGSDLEGLAPDVAAFGETFMTDPEIEEEFVELLRRADELGCPVTVHAEDLEMLEEGLERERGGPAESYSDARPAEAEVEAAERAVEAAEDAGVELHFCHLSTPEAAELVLESGHTAESTLHHLLLNREALQEFGPLGKCNPPLRSEERRQGLWEFFLGSDLMVASDHAPHLKRRGDDFWGAPAGIPGVQTTLPVLLDLWRGGDVPLERIVEACCAAPAELMGLPKGRIEPGMDADLVLFDTDRAAGAGEVEMFSKSGYTPFEGFDALYPVETLVRGERVYREGGFPGDGSGRGRLYRGEELRKG